MHTAWLGLLLVTGAYASVARLGAQGRAPDGEYLVFVASEGNDRIALIRFGPAGAKVERDHRMGINPTELLGPHGIAVQIEVHDIDVRAVGGHLKRRGEGAEVHSTHE